MVTALQATQLSYAIKAISLPIKGLCARIRDVVSSFLIYLVAYEKMQPLHLTYEKGVSFIASPFQRNETLSESHSKEQLPRGTVVFGKHLMLEAPSLSERVNPFDPY